MNGLKKFNISHGIFFGRMWGVVGLSWIILSPVSLVSGYTELSIIALIMGSIIILIARFSFYRASRMLYPEEVLHKKWVFWIFMWKGGRVPFNLYLSNNIDARKVGANLLVFKHMSFEVAESYSKFDKKEEELLKFATESIKKIDFLGGVPLGFSPEFVATYPDVLLWWNSLSDEKQDGLLKDFDEDDLLDENQKIKSKYLKVIVEAYKNTGATLECLIGGEKGSGAFLTNLV